MLRSLLCLAFCVLFAVPAAARNITSEVQYFNNITVKFSENADVCGLKDPQPFIEHAEKRLSEMDLPKNPDAKTLVAIYITATGRGFLKRDCLAHIQVQLRTFFNADFIDLSAYEGEDQIFAMLSQRNYRFPIVFYEGGRLYAGYHQDMQDLTIEALDKVMDQLNQSRLER
jgi:hypothetical protein